jgi:hypothetical protein
LIVVVLVIISVLIFLFVYKKKGEGKTPADENIVYMEVEPEVFEVTSDGESNNFQVMDSNEEPEMEFISFQ